MLLVVIDPDRPVVLVELGGDRRDGREHVPLAQKVEHPIARRHPFSLAAVAGLDPKRRKPVTAGCRVILGRQGDHPVATGHTSLRPRSLLAP